MKARKSPTSHTVYASSIFHPIQPAPGFDKKWLATHHLELLGVCEADCTFCSTVMSTLHRMKKRLWAELALQQRGVRLVYGKDHGLTVFYTDVIERLKAQLERKRPSFGRGKTLMLSMLTDAFSPSLAEEGGTTRQALDLVLDRTEFRIRILTKFDAVGDAYWVDYFAAHPGRFVVGLSTGTTDIDWARRVELGTSSPADRLQALHRLQAAGVPTFGMLCPVFHDCLEGDALKTLVDRVRPDLVEELWAEPYNDRSNWEQVRKGYRSGSQGEAWLTEVFEKRNLELWSNYATELYLRLKEKALAEGWLEKLRYLLYEIDVTKSDVARFGKMEGVLLQSRDEEGLSKNPHFRRKEAALKAWATRRLSGLDLQVLEQDST